MTASDIARVYATSLLEIGQEKNILPRLEQEFKFVSELISHNMDLRALLTSPGFSTDKKIALINKAFYGRLSDYVVNCINLLIKNGRQNIIGDIYKALLDQIDLAGNKQRVTVISRYKLDRSIIKKIKARLKRKINKVIILREETDESILGGIIIKINDLVIDGSLKNDLKNIEIDLLNRRIGSDTAYED